MLLIKFLLEQESKLDYRNTQLYFRAVLQDPHAGHNIDHIQSWQNCKLGQGGRAGTTEPTVAAFPAILRDLPESKAAGSRFDASQEAGQKSIGSKQ